MSYQKAHECFAENQRLIQDPMSDALNWNLNAGLDELTETIQQDIAQIQAQLAHIVRMLGQR